MKSCVGINLGLRSRKFEKVEKVEEVENVKDAEEAEKVVGVREVKTTWPTAESITNDLLFLPHAAAEELDT